MSQESQTTIRGITAAFATPVFLGMAPILGKLAINVGTDSFSVAAIRTLIAAALLWLVYAAFFRKYIYIYPAGFIGCIVIGSINGIGSLFYYGGLGFLDASLVQLLNGMYLAFAVLLSRVGGQTANPRTLFRVTLAMVALLMITGFGSKPIDWTGVGMMLGSALMFAGTVILSQYVLYEMPAPTVALYVLTTMAVVVTMVWLAVGETMSQDVLTAALPSIILLGITTALARLAMFAGVKFLGGMQTAILAITEIAVALLLAYIILDERLTTLQWVGVGILFTGMFLIRQSDLLPRGVNPNALIVPNMASVQFQRIAFHRAFGTSETDNEAGTMSNITTQEMVAIQRMMGANLGGIDPYPIGQLNKLTNEPAMPSARPFEQQLDESLPDDLFETQEIEMPEELDSDPPPEES